MSYEEYRALHIAPRTAQGVNPRGSLVPAESTDKRAHLLQVNRLRSG